MESYTIFELNQKMKGQIFLNMPIAAEYTRCIKRVLSTIMNTISINYLLVDEMKNHGLVVTSGGKLSCRHIIHIRSQKDKASWEKMVGTGT